MKKIILLLILPLITLMAIDFTMTRDGLIAPSRIDNSSDNATAPVTTPSTAPVTSSTTVTTTATSGTSPYLEPVNLPECDASNPEVQFIKSNADWSTINNSSKRIFCVSPGDYRTLGRISLTASGTAEKRRYIVLNNGDDIHPGILTDNKRAKLPNVRINASYWIIDRMASLNIPDHAIRFYSNGTNNIINRAYMSKFGYGVTVGSGAHDNTIQNSRFENQTDPGYDGPVAVQLFQYHVDAVEIKNTKVINNEFYNCNDSFQIARGPKGDGTDLYQSFNAEGTIIDSCQFYKDIPYMENAFDIKAGSDNPNNPVIISNNIMHGYRRHPDYVSGAYPAGQTALLLHLEPHNVKIYNNIMFDNDNAIDTGAADPKYGVPYALCEGEVYNNVMYDNGSITYTKYSIKASSMRNTNLHDNYIIDPINLEGQLYANNTNSFFDNTKVVNPSEGSIKFIGYDRFPNSSEFQAGAGASVVDNATWYDFVFTMDAFTNSPTVIILPKVLDPNGAIVSPQ